MAVVVVEKGGGGVGKGPPAIYTKGNSLKKTTMTVAEFLDLHGKHILLSMAKICNSNDYNIVIDQ